MSHEKNCSASLEKLILWLLPVGFAVALFTLFVLLGQLLVVSPVRQPTVMRFVETVSAEVTQPVVQLPASEATLVALTATPVVPSTSSMVEHPVQPGETLIAILKRYCREQDYRQVASHNGIDPDRIYAGRTVLRFQSGCDAKAVPVEATQQSARQATVSPASRETRQLVEREARAVPRQVSVASVSRTPTPASGEGCESGLARGYVGAGRAALPV